ncbi:unnamed protein product [Diabrotica balteata]|uniref:Uncharacterized protein n=1 Tax=Diabrotica balteata TaxID=107213 RepID=A0A9N9SPD1_DIABA|nr:unnamed protein product [Diabrotica balteata]
MRRLVADKKHHHKRHSKKLNKDGKQNHVSFPEFQQNGTAKQFCSGDFMRVSTPTATEMMLPWKREEEGCVPILQSEFPGWASNKEYLAYNSPSATFLGGLENPRSSVIGLFRRESIGSEQSCSAESTPQKERRNSSGRSTSLLVDDSEKESDPLGIFFRSITRDIIPEEAYGTSSLRRPSWVNSNTAQRRSSFTRQPTTLGASLMTTVSSPSPTPSDDSTDDADIDCLMKAGF